MARLWLITLLIVGLMAAPASGFSLMGKTSWYGGTCDSGDNNIPAYLPKDKNMTPGIAIRATHTKRKHFLLKMIRTKRKVVVIHSDYGPATWTGRAVDVNWKAATGLGYRASGQCVQGFPTDSRIKARLLTKKRQVKYWVKKTKTKVDDRAF